MTQRLYLNLGQKSEEEVKQLLSKTEKCVLCGSETNIPRDLHIDFRTGYVEGVGQLCINCFIEI